MIVAVDFDGCLVSDAYPEIGKPNTLMINIIKYHQINGDHIILWTCRTDGELSRAIEWCENQGIRLDAVNTNLPHVQAKYGGDTRKVFADVYYDDKAINVTPSHGAQYPVQYTGIMRDFSRAVHRDKVENLGYFLDERIKP